MLCSKCGAFFGPEKATVSVKCHRCDDHHYDHAFAALIYEKAAAASLLQLKKTPRPSAVLRDALISAIDRADLGSIDIIIPVPLSKRRRIDRGFNQAETIADIVSGRISIPVDTGSLIRTKHTHIHRQGMDTKARDMSVTKAFTVTRPKMIAKKHILLVDDIFTSGATSSHCAEILKKNGAASVMVFTAARAVWDQL